MGDSKASKLRRESSSKGSKLMGKQVGVGWFKMIQARERHTIQNDPSQKFKNIQAKTLPYTITYNQKKEEKNH